MFQQRWDGTLNLAADARLAAAPARIWAVETVNGFLRLSEVFPDCSDRIIIGNLFTTAGATCHGLTWDEDAGELKALIRVGSAQYIYEINTVDGHAGAPKLIPSNTPALSGLASQAGVLYSFDSARNLYSVTSTGSVLNVGRVAGKSLSGITTAVSDVQTDDGQTFLVASGNAIYTYVRSSNRTTAVTLPAFSAGIKSSLTKFGNNLYVSNDGAIRFARANTLSTIQNTVLPAVSRATAASHAVAKKNEHTVYMVFGINQATTKLYQLNLDGTVSEKGTLGIAFRVTALVWGSHTNKLYAFAQDKIYTVDETTGVATLLATISGLGEDHLRWGFELDSNRFVMLDRNGGARHISHTGVASNVFITPGGTSGGVYQNGYYTVSQGQGTIFFKQNTTSSTQSLLTLTSPHGMDHVFEIRGELYGLHVVATGGNTWTPALFKYDSLFPEFYVRGTLLDYLKVDDPTDIMRVKADASVTEILPAAYGGKGPYTYEVKRAGSTGLPNGIEFNSNSRGLTVDPATTAVGQYILAYVVRDSEDPARVITQAFVVRIGPAPGVGTGALSFSPGAVANISLVEGTARVVALPPATTARGTLLYDVLSTDPGYGDQLPPGFEFNDTARSLEISGSVPVGTYTFRYTMYDEFTRLSFPFTVSVTALFTLPSIGNVSLFADQDYTQTLPESVGGQGARTYRVVTTTTGSVTINPGSLAGFTGWLRNLSTGATLAGSVTGSTFPTSNRIFAVFRRGFTTSILRSGTGNYIRSMNIDGTNYTAGRKYNGRIAALNSVTGIPAGNYSITEFNGLPTGALRNTVLVLDENGANTPGESDLPIGLSFDPATRLFSVDGATSTAGTYNLRYVANVGGTVRNEDFTITISPTTTLRLPDMRYTIFKGADRTLTLPSATGGDDDNYVYSIAERVETPNFAADLNSATRVLTVDDAETQPGTYVLDYQVSDQAGQVAVATITVVVQPEPPALSLPDPDNVTIYKNEPAQSFSLPEAAGGIPAYTYTLVQSDDSPLPTGITFTPSTRALSLLSSQVAAGTFTLKYTVTDTDGTAVSQTFTVTVFLIRPIPLTLPGVQDKEYRAATLPQTFLLPTASGGSGNKRYTLEVADNENNAVSFNPTTRRVTVGDNTSPGRHLCTYTVRDDSDTKSVSFQLTVNAQLSLPQDIPQITLRKGDAVYTEVLPVAGGFAPNAVYSVLSLVTGMRFNAVTRELTIDPDELTVGRHRIVYAVVSGTDVASSAIIVNLGSVAVPPTPARERVPEPVAAAPEAPVGDATPQLLTIPPLEPLERLDQFCEDEELGEGEYIENSGSHSVALSDLPAPRSTNDAVAINRPVPTPAGLTVGQNPPTLNFDTNQLARARYEVRACRPNHGVAKQYADLTADNKDDFFEWTWTTQGAAFYGNPTNGYLPGTRTYNGTNKDASFSGWFNGHVRSLLRALEPHWCDNSYAGKRLLLKVAPVSTGTSSQWSVCGATQGTGGGNFGSGAGITDIVIEDRNGNARYYRRASAAGAASLSAAAYAEQTTATDFYTVHPEVCQAVTRTVREPLEVCPAPTAAATPLPTEVAAPLTITPPPARVALELADQRIDAVSGCDTFKVTLPRATGGTGEVAYSVGTLPGLIRYIPSQHALIGPESAAQSFDVILMATDATGTRTRATISVDVRPVGFADTPLHKTLLYRQSSIKDLVNRRLALEIDITDMRVYKQETTLQVRFIADTGVEQSLLDLTDVRAGKFSVRREGERLFMYIAPEVIRGMYGPLQEQTAGCWVLDIRSALEPLRHRTVFGNEDIAEDVLEEEFKRLDIQDQTKIDEIKQTRNVEPKDIATAAIKDDAVRGRHLNEAAVQKNSLVASAVTGKKLDSRVVTTAKLAPNSIVGSKLEQDTIKTGNLGTLSVQKLAKPADKGALNAVAEERIDAAAVTSDKLRDDSVPNRAIQFGAVKTAQIEDGAIDGSKIAPRSLSTHNLQARGFTRELADGEITGAHLAQGSITRRVLDWLNLGKYFKNSGELLNLPVKNPQQIPPGTPVGMHVLPGDTEPTVFRLTDTYEYAQPEPPAQTERDISIYGDLPEGGTPEGSGETTDDDVTGSGYAKIAIKPLVLKNGTTDTNVTKPYNPGGIGVSALNTMQVNGKWLVAYLVPGVYLHTDTKVYTPGQAVGSAVSGASHDWTIPNNRLNLVIEVRDELRNPETTTQFYMNTVMWHTGIDFASDRLNPYTAIAMDKIPGAERRGGIYIGLHAGIVDENAFNRHKVLGSNWSVPATAGTPNNLPPARTQLYAFSFSNDTLSSEKNDAYIQTLIEYPRPQNGNKTYKTRSDYRVGSSDNHGADVDATLRAEVAQGYAHLPGLGLSMWAETNSLFVMRRGAQGFEDSPEVPLLHFAVPGVGYDRGPRNMCTYWDNAFGRKGTNNNNHWAINFGRAYSDSDASASDLSGIVSRRSSHLTITLPTSVVSRAGINGLRGYGGSRLPGQAGPPITYAALGSINMRTPTAVVESNSGGFAQTHVFNRPVMYSRYAGVEPGSGYNMTLPVEVKAHPGDSANKMDTYLPLYNENTFPPVPSDSLDYISYNLYRAPVTNIIQTLPGGTGLWYGKTKVVGTTSLLALNYVRVQQVAFPVLGTLLQTMFVQMVGLGRTTAIASWQHSDNGVDTVNMERRLIRLGDNGDLEYDSE